MLLIAATVTLIDPRRTWELMRRLWRGVLAVAVVTTLATLYQVAWILTDPPGSATDNRRPFDLPVILGQIVLWMFQWIGAFPFRDEPTSPVTYVACGTAFVVFFVEGLRRGDAKRWVAVAVITTCLILPLLYTLATFTEDGTLWQGRYAIPFLIGAPILVGLALDRPECERRIIQQLVAVLGIFSTSAAVIHMVHQELHRPASFDDSHWQAPPAIAIILLAAAAAGCFSMALWCAGKGSASGGVQDATARESTLSLRPVSKGRNASESRVRPFEFFLLMLMLKLGAVLWISVNAGIVPVDLSLVFMASAAAIWQGPYEVPLVIGILPLWGLRLDACGAATQLPRQAPGLASEFAPVLTDAASART
jgi:hypothetical protein